MPEIKPDPYAHPLLAESHAGLPAARKSYATDLEKLILTGCSHPSCWSRSVTRRRYGVCKGT